LALVVFALVVTPAGIALLAVCGVRAGPTVNDAALRIVALAVVRLSVTVLRVGKRHRAAGTSDEQPRCHEACRRGDTHTRSHSVTTSQDNPHTL
jgi:hypothetical protein